MTTSGQATTARTAANKRRSRGYLAVETAVLAGLLVAPFVLPLISMSMDVMTRSLIWGLFGLGFSILFGFTGLLSPGQAAFYGAGGFLASYLLTNGFIQQTLVALLIGTLAACVLGLAIGLLVERSRGIYFAMITLAFGEMFYHLDYSTLSDYTGGEPTGLLGEARRLIQWLRAGARLTTAITTKPPRLNRRMQSLRKRMNPSRNTGR